MNQIFWMEYYTQYWVLKLYISIFVTSKYIRLWNISLNELLFSVRLYPRGHFLKEDNHLNKEIKNDIKEEKGIYKASVNNIIEELRIVRVSTFYCAKQWLIIILNFFLPNKLIFYQID